MRDHELKLPAATPGQTVGWGSRHTWAPRYSRKGGTIEVPIPTWPGWSMASPPSMGSSHRRREQRLTTSPKPLHLTHSPSCRCYAAAGSFNLAVNNRLGPRSPVANDRLRHMRIGDARVSKADGSQSLDLQRDALRASTPSTSTTTSRPASATTARDSTGLKQSD